MTPPRPPATRGPGLHKLGYAFLFLAHHGVLFTGVIDNILNIAAKFAVITVAPIFVLDILPSPCTIVHLEHISLTRNFLWWYRQTNLTTLSYPMSVMLNNLKKTSS